MNKNSFEQKYMERSWKEKGVGFGYRSFDLDPSIPKLGSFLKAKKVSGSLLDIGCGNGKNAIFFAKKGFDVTAFDFSKSAVKITKNYAKQRNAKVNAKVGDVLKVRDKKKFDVIIDCGCLHHLRKKYWPAYRKTILANIKPGGYYYIHGFSASSKKLNSRLPKNRSWNVKDGHYTTFFGSKEIETFFSKSFKLLNTYEFLSLSKKFIVRAYYFRKK